MTGRVALVTGAAGGLGRAMARGLSSTGHAVVLLDLDRAALEELARDIRVAQPKARLATLTGDLGEPATIPGLVEAACAAFGQVDILVNNAGLGLDRIRHDFMQRPIVFWEVDPALTQRFFAVNGLSPFLLTQALVPPMIERGFGRVVNVTTSLDSMIRKGFAPYGGSKASLEAHSAIMAHDLAGTGVTVNVLVPGGPADTAMIPAETGFARERLIQPEVMVPPLLWLVAEEAADVTGHRVLAVHWHGHGSTREALAAASGPAAWPQLGAQTTWPADDAAGGRT